jgi:ribose 5-phosphate isomerase B
MMTDRVLIASDHVGVELKVAIKSALSARAWIDLGPTDSAKVDYPDYAASLAWRLLAGEAPHGVLICGSGIGMSIAANKARGIRAAVVENPVAARLSREHNDANVLCLGSRFVAPAYGVEIVRAWLEATFGGDDKHRKRLQKIAEMERG